MTVESQQVRIIYDGDGESTAFTVPFPFIRPDHLYVYVGTGELGTTDILLARGAEYTVTGHIGPDGGYLHGEVTLASPLPVGRKVAMMRVVPLTQELDYPEGGRFPASSHETALDKATMALQQLQDIITRTPYGPPTSGASGTVIIEEMTKWYEETRTNAANAATDAARAEYAANRADSSAALAKDQADRASELVDAASLASSAFNVWRSWVTDADIAAGDVMTMPVYYYPKRDLVLLIYKGTVCVPLKANIEPTGEYQYAEIGDDPDVLSNRVTLYFDAPANSKFDIWVVASAAGRNIEELEILVAEARTAAESASDSETAAEDAADRAELAAACVPDITTATAGQVVTARVVNGTMTAVYASAPGGGRAKTETVAPLALPAGSSFAVPAYTVGAGKLDVYLSGVLCATGTTAADGFYAETGAPGSQSTSITIFDAIPAGKEITAIAVS